MAMQMPPREDDEQLRLLEWKTPKSLTAYWAATHPREDDEQLRLLERHVAPRRSPVEAPQRPQPHRLVVIVAHVHHDVRGCLRHLRVLGAERAESFKSRGSDLLELVLEAVDECSRLGWEGGAHFGIGLKGLGFRGRWRT